jgi:NADH-quinone oxidoreductase subunit E
MTTRTQSALEALVGPEATAELDAWVAKYPEDRKRSAVMAGLMIAQRANGGHLTTELMDAVADYLGIPHVSAYEVATFYSMYSLKPVGKHVINVCTNISCMLRGSDDILQHIEKRLGIKPGETTADGQFTLRAVECQGACAGAPMLEVDQQFHEHLTPESVDALIDRLAHPAE